ncbi:MAG: TolC family protein [Chitinophagales bacterium]|nr:TolC family protein [Chitinophagales bacterium]
MQKIRCCKTKLNMFTPNVNATVTEGINFANSINPLTYSFVQQNTNSTSFGLYLDYSLFEGLSRWNQHLASEKELTATQLEQEMLENNTRLTVASYYLNVMLANESQNLASEKYNLTKKQHENTKTLVSAGILSQADLVEVEAQQANDNLDYVNAQNNYVNARYQLLQLLQLDPNMPFGVKMIEPTSLLTDKQYDFNAIHNEAINLMPNIKAAELRKHAAELKLKAAKGSLSPTISFSAYLGSNYFSATQEQTGTSTAVIPVGYVDGTNQLVYTSYSQPVLSNKAFGNQVKDNFNQNIRFNLSIPIFAKWQRMIGIDNAKINVLNANYEIENAKNKLQQDVFTAFSNYNMAQSKIDAAQKK